MAFQWRVGLEQVLLVSALDPHLGSVYRSGLNTFCDLHDMTGATVSYLKACIKPIFANV